MQRSDYLLRLIEQLGRAIQRVRELLLKTPAAAELELKEAAHAAGYSLDLLRVLTPDTIASLVDPTGKPDGLRCVLMAELMAADLLIANASSDEAARADRRAKLDAVLELIPQDQDPTRRALAMERLEPIRALIPPADTKQY